MQLEEMMEDPAGGDEPALVYANVGAFVTEHLAHFYVREYRSTARRAGWHWCGQWWRHEEAVSRLTGLWRAWEALRLDPTTGLSAWWINYADPTMRALTGDDGAFVGCSADQHEPKGIRLPLIPPPAGLFD